jgi:hypothetical protein
MYYGSDVETTLLLPSVKSAALLADLNLKQHVTKTLCERSWMAMNVYDDMAYENRITNYVARFRAMRHTIREYDLDVEEYTHFLSIMHQFTMFTNHITAV